MDVLYILGKGSRWNNNELRYSLRSLEKHLRGYTRIFITGEKPEFINDEVIYNYYPDEYLPNLNHLYKVLATFKLTDISDDILLNYDDNFFVSDVGIKDYPYYYKREVLPDSFPITNIHTRSMMATKKILQELNKPIKDFAVHCPIRYNRHHFYDFVKAFDKYIDKNNKQASISVRCAYTNNLEIKGEYLADLKFNKSLTMQDIEQKIKGRNVFSTSDNIQSGNTIDFLQQRFPNKSRWEK